MSVTGCDKAMTRVTSYGLVAGGQDLAKELVTVIPSQIIQIWNPLCKRVVTGSFCTHLGPIWVGFLGQTKLASFEDVTRSLRFFEASRDPLEGGVIA